MSKRTPHRRNPHSYTPRPSAGGRAPNYTTPSLRKKRVKKIMHKRQTWKGGMARKRKKTTSKGSS